MSGKTDHVEFTAMKKLEQDHLHPLVAHPRADMSRPGIKHGPPRWKTCTSYSNIIFIAYSEHLHELAAVLHISAFSIFSLKTPSNPVPEIIDTVFAKTSPKRSFSMTEYERFGLVFTKTRVCKFGHWCVSKSRYHPHPPLPSLFLVFYIQRMFPINTVLKSHLGEFREAPLC
jgi:hypothetical protein